MGEPGTIRAVLWVRTLSLDHVDDEVDRLDRLVENEQLDRYDIEVWGSRIAVDTPAAGGNAAIRKTFDEMIQWATDLEYTLAPAFERRTVGSLIAEDSREVVVFPVRCLAIYEWDELRAVYPHADDDTIYTVADGLDTLETIPDAPRNRPSDTGAEPFRETRITR